MIFATELKSLAGISGPCLTIYHPLNGGDVRSNLLTATHQAESLLAGAGLNVNAAAEFLRPIRKVASNTGWRGRSGSIAIFRAPGYTKASFWPDVISPGVYLSDEFTVFPLLPGMDAIRNFWVLALSLNHIRLFRGTTERLEEIELPARAPHSLREAGGFDVPDHDLESRSAAGSSNGSMSAVRSGMPAMKDFRLRYMHDFFRTIDGAVRHTLNGSTDPLILAGVSRELAMYREVNTYPHLSTLVITGSPDRITLPRLHAKAVELVRGTAAANGTSFLHQMEEAAARGLLLKDAASICKAAREGRVQSLFVGVHDRDKADLMNSVALAVLRNSGVVHWADESIVPTGAAAILRYHTGPAVESELPAL